MNLDSYLIDYRDYLGIGLFVNNYTCKDKVAYI